MLARTWNDIIGSLLEHYKSILRKDLLCKAIKYAENIFDICPDLHHFPIKIYQSSYE